MDLQSEIHDGPYNDIPNWDYAGLMDAFNAPPHKTLLSASDQAKASGTSSARRSKAWGMRVASPEELDAAILRASKDDLRSSTSTTSSEDDSKKRLRSAAAMIECVVAREDCSKELHEWGARMSKISGRSPAPEREF